MMIAFSHKNELVQSKSNREYVVRMYIDVRRKEQRLYTNEEVKLLPDVPASHPLSKEWQIRKRSAKMLVEYLQKKKQPLNVLEVGCGNGWLSAMLAKLPQSSITGIDINEVELSQAKEVFDQLSNSEFISTTIDGLTLSKRSFDVIVFAGSIQYFASMGRVIKLAQSLLKNRGEIHIVDTHFNKTAEVDAVKSRINEFDTLQGLPGMSRYYYHHSLADFSPFNFSVLYGPSFFQKKILGNKHPFYWIKIKGKG